MTVQIFPSKIELVDGGKAIVTVVIASDLGLLKLDLATEQAEGDANAILQNAREALRKFGNELLNEAGRKPLRFLLPPK